jgi:KipI family sensor histidine kinase inhibitor
MSVRCLAAGDCAVAIELDGDIGLELNRRLRALEWLLSEGRLCGVIETVPSFRSLLVYYDPDTIGYEALCAAIEARAGQTAHTSAPGARSIEIPCCYDDPQLGSDLHAVAARLGMSVETVIGLHSAAEYLVYFIGFAPGQPYLTGLAPQLAIPRLESPRTTTPAGAVGIGGTQGCIYSVESPGGFWILGGTPLRLYDPEAAAPILLEPGDRLRFRRIGRAEHDAIAAAVANGSYRPRIA